MRKRSGGTLPGDVTCLPERFKYVFKHKHIMVKTLTIRDEVYNKLVKVKGKDESFSELFLELIEKRRFTGDDLKEYAGILSEKEYQRMKRETKKLRKEVSKSFEKRVQRFSR